MLNILLYIFTWINVSHTWLFNCSIKYSYCWAINILTPWKAYYEFPLKKKVFKLGIIRYLTKKILITTNKRTKILYKITYKENIIGTNRKTHSTGTYIVGAAVYSNRVDHARVHSPLTWANKTNLSHLHRTSTNTYTTAFSMPPVECTVQVCMWLVFAKHYWEVGI